MFKVGDLVYFDGDGKKGVLEITMEELEQKYGKKVKIIK